MEPDDLLPILFPKVAQYRVREHLLQVFEGIRLGENRKPKRLRLVTAFRDLINRKYDLFFQYYYLPGYAQSA